ncbi:MAG: dicarboxylate/amino acid:cation symporter [Firmicutes bacterium]|nr:dicarboxylate/amino acid:cation symporter [Bacillota bacterium]
MIKRIPEWSKVLLALILAVIVGSIMGPNVQIFEPLGQAFLRLITMMVIPIVFTSLTLGAGSVNDIRKLGRIGGKTIGAFLATTSIAVGIGALIGTILQPGSNLSLSTEAGEVAAREAPALAETFLNIIPRNIFVAFTEVNMLQIIFFALFLGIALNLVEKKYSEPVNTLLAGLSTIFTKMISLIMKLTPLGVFGLMAPVAGEYGLDAVLPLLKVIFAVYLGCLLLLAVYAAALYLLAGVNPLDFFRKIFPVQMIAFSTSSSAATLPTTMQVAKQRLKLSDNVVSFTLPLGGTINMDGGAIYQGIAVIFTAQIFGIELGLFQLLTVILTATLATIGTAGVPGMGIITLALVLQSVGLPLEGVALLAGIERLLDMIRTLTNVTSDLAVAQIVDVSENKKNTSQTIAVDNA